MIQATKFAVDTAWTILLKDLGVSEDEVLRRAQLPLDLFSRKNASLTAEEYFRLWKGMEVSLNDPAFPLRLGQMISTEAFSPPLFAALCSPNLYVAMKRLSRYKQLIGPMKLQVEKDTEATTVSLDCLFTVNPLPDSLIATELVFLVQLVRLCTREQIIPLSVSTSSKIANHEGYSEYFGVIPNRRETNQLKFSIRDSCRPFLTEKQNMWQFFEPQLRKRLTEMDAEATFSSRVRSSLFELLPSGLGATKDVAKKLGVSKRTLQRHLSNENTSFQQELNKTRERLARHYLNNSAYSGAEISFLLGFEDPNSFLRAFRSWTGETPDTVRARTMH